jgi:transcriptional antiterminator NusG
MLFENQEEQTLNSEETPIGENEPLETSETVSADVEAAESSLESQAEEPMESEPVEAADLTSTDPESTDLESEDEEQVEPEAVEVSELSSTDPEVSDLESEDEEQVEPEAVEVSEPSSTDPEETDLESEDEEQVEPEPDQESEPASAEADSTLEPPDEQQMEPDPTIAEIESSEAELEITEEEAEPGSVEISAEQPTSTEETEPPLSEAGTADLVVESIDEVQPESSEFDQDGRSWFVVHCYSGYENKVRHNLEQRIETMGMKDKIFDIVVPTEEEIEVKEGKRRTVERRVFPGYILVNMVMTEESWYVVRNTPGVTGFVGMGNTPTPLRPEEVSQIIKRMEAEAPRIKVTFKSGERVRIVDGPFNDFRGTVAEIDMERAKVRVMVNFFGRETPVELDFLQVEKT